jgi:hypothetical protein
MWIYIVVGIIAIGIIIFWIRKAYNHEKEKLENALSIIHGQKPKLNQSQVKEITREAEKRRGAGLPPLAVCANCGRYLGSWRVESVRGRNVSLKQVDENGKFTGIIVENIGENDDTIIRNKSGAPAGECGNCGMLYCQECAPIRELWGGATCARRVCPRCDSVLHLKAGPFQN